MGILNVISRGPGFTEDDDGTHLFGFWPLVNEILGREKNCLNGCYGRIYLDTHSICVIEVTLGELVLRSLKTDSIKTQLGPSEVKLVSHKGTHVTILDELKNFELYTRIKVYYEKVLKECLGKTADEQSDFLFGPEERIRRTKAGISLKEGLVEASEEYIRSLGISLSAKQIVDLCKHIKQGLLEYAYHAPDEYSVKMIWYAEELDARL